MVDLTVVHVMFPAVGDGVARPAEGLPAQLGEHVRGGAPRGPGRSPRPGGPAFAPSPSR